MIENDAALTQLGVALQTTMAARLAEWTHQHHLTDMERQRILSVLDCEGVEEQDFHDELANILARRRIDRVQLDRAKLLAIGEAYRHEMRQKRSQADTQVSS